MHSFSLFRQVTDASGYKTREFAASSSNELMTWVDSINQAILYAIHLHNTTTTTTPTTAHSERYVDRKKQQSKVCV